MAADRSYIADNDRERRRLEALVGKLDDAALSRTMPDGWTVAGVLAHLAFWDQRIVTFIELLKRGVKVPVTPRHRLRQDSNRATRPSVIVLVLRRQEHEEATCRRQGADVGEELDEHTLA